MTELKARQPRGLKKAAASAPVREETTAPQSPDTAPPAGALRTEPAVAPTPAAAPAPLPAGTSLEDPKNFGLLPDLTLLQKPGEEASADRERLISALQFAKRVLQTSRVPAAVWREWRKFEQDAAAVLRTAGVARVD